MENSITWVGIDAHKETLSVAVMRDGSTTVDESVVPHTDASVRKLVRSLIRDNKGSEIRMCYEAGVCGYALQRRIEAAGPVVCDVVAPSLIPRMPGDRIKTDRRDAKKLGELLRAGLLTRVAPPTLEQESVRDLCRCRATLRADLHRSRHRLLKLLLRRGLVFPGTVRHWGKAHRAWLKAIAFDNAVDRFVFDDYLLAVEQGEQRLKSIDAELKKASQLPLYREHVAWLRCFRGVDTVAALVFLAELHGVGRFDSPRKLAAYLGLVPSEHSSASSIRRGPLTKTGNSHIRRVLLQSAWHYRNRPAVGPKLRKRREGQPSRVIAIADEAQRRLHRRYQRLTARGKHANRAVIAVLRELVGFLWAALQPDQQARSAKQADGVRHEQEKGAGQPLRQG